MGRKSTLRLIAVIILVVLIVLAGVYVYKRYHEVTPEAQPEVVTPAANTTHAVRVNESAESIYFDTLQPAPQLTQVSFEIYEPGSGHAYWNVTSLDRQSGGAGRTDLMPGINASFHDLNNDSKVTRGDFLTVECSGGLTEGIWHVELSYPGYTGGNTTFHFHVLPAGVTSIRENATVDFIDVGQGDAELITTSDGRHVLIDAGPGDHEVELLDYLHNRSLTTLDALIISHPDEDHIGGADGVLHDFVVLSVYHPGYMKDTAAYRNFISAAEAEGCPIYTNAQVQPGDYLDLSDTEDFRVLAINASASSTNDASIVVKMAGETKGFLFTGDIDTSVEASLIEDYPADLHADYLKVAHHGSRYASSQAFLQVVEPSEAIIEVGADNDYGHPAGSTLDRLAADHITVLRTDLNGTVEITVTGGTIT